MFRQEELYKPRIEDVTKKVKGFSPISELITVNISVKNIRALEEILRDNENRLGKIETGDLQFFIFVDKKASSTIFKANVGFFDKTDGAEIYSKDFDEIAGFVEYFYNRKQKK